MIKSKTEWVVWTIIGVLLLAAFICHYTRVFVLPDVVLTPVVFLLGVYAAIYVDAIADRMRSK